MRLTQVATGHRLKERFKLAMIKLFSRHEPEDVVKTLMYRPEFWGKPHCDLTQAVMRGPSSWSVGEREVFAAFVSKLNQCPF